MSEEFELRNFEENGSNEGQPKKLLPILGILRYADNLAKIWFFLGIFGILLGSLIWPMCNILLGDVVKIFVNFELDIHNVPFMLQVNTTSALKDLFISSLETDAIFMLGPNETLILRPNASFLLEDNLNSLLEPYTNFTAREIFNSNSTLGTYLSSILGINLYQTFVNNLTSYLGPSTNPIRGANWTTLLEANSTSIYSIFQAEFNNSNSLSNGLDLKFILEYIMTSSTVTDALAKIATEDEEPIRNRFIIDVYKMFCKMLTLSFLYWLGNFFTIYTFNRFSMRQMRTIRLLYVNSMLRQDAAWLDSQKLGDFAVIINGNFKKFENGSNQNFGLLLYQLVQAFFNIGVALFYGPKLAGALIAIGPVMAIAALVIAKFTKKYEDKVSAAEKMATSTFEEIFAAIRTVTAFNGQEKEKDRYRRALEPAAKNGCKQHFCSSLIPALNWGQLYLAMAFGLWYGVKLMHSDKYKLADVVTIFWAIMSAGYSISKSAPELESLQTARSVAPDIFALIERQPNIDLADKEGQTLAEDFETSLEFRNVCFSYPSRPLVKVLDDLNLKIRAGETVAFVGPSGSGKSTIVQLIQRFYDPKRGQVYLNGVNLAELNVGFLRQQMGVVGQEPMLFEGTIEDNIRLGLPLDQISTASHAEVEHAAQQANAQEFIESLPQGYATYVGDRGTQLSGGQKQRIAIARALIGNPKILLLDEATSALDMRSEQVVQVALDQASRGRTTIIVAHRLSTIMNADRIIYLHKGRLMEMGSHMQLMSHHGPYYKLVSAQRLAKNGIEDIVETAKTVSTPETSTLEISTTKISTIEISTPGTSTSKAPTQGTSTKQTEEPDDLEPIENLIEASDDLATSESINQTEVDKQMLTAFTYRQFLSHIKNKNSLVAAIIASLIYGVLTPTYALIFGSYVDIFGTTRDATEQLSKTRRNSYEFLVLSVVSLVVIVSQSTFFGAVTERLTMRLRVLALNSLMNQEITYFDRKENSAAGLVTQCAQNVASIRGATGVRLGLLCQVFSATIYALSIGFYYNWRFALFSIFMLPVMIFTTFTSAKMHSKADEQDCQSSQELGRQLIEVINGKRTIDSLHKQAFFYSKFEGLIQKNYREITNQGMRRILLLSFSLSSLLYFYSLSFLIGGFLMSYSLLKSGDFFRVIESMLFGAQTIGNAASWTADFRKAKVGTQKFMEIIAMPPSCNFGYVERVRPAAPIEGVIEARGLHFEYPSRPGASILNGLSFKVGRGQTLALVGQSGCGKSTALQLLEQFYTPTAGLLLIDGQPITSLDIDWLRAQMTIVSQEPALFSYSIRENIAYGDNKREEIPLEEIVRAAQMANVHECVMSLPQGYETPVGSKGSQLSGGQKQRIAIARSLIRNPTILLLDEATSALDSESETKVQAALDEASKGRTCIVIAHRLKTIVNADKIVVIEKGVNVEEGTHRELVAKRGFYWSLYNQSCDETF